MIRPIRGTTAGRYSTYGRQPLNRQGIIGPVRLLSVALLLPVLFILIGVSIGSKAYANNETPQAANDLIIPPLANTSGNYSPGPFENYNPPYSTITSAWFEQWQNQASDTLARSNYDLLFVPFQPLPDSFEFDASAHSLFSLITATTLQRSGINVADPVLTAEALGLNQTNFKKTAIVSIAEKIGAKRILSGHAGHDGNGKFRVTFTLFELPGFTQIATIQRDSIPFSATSLPYSAFNAIHHELLGELFDTTMKPTERHAGRSGLDLTLAVQQFVNTHPAHPMESAERLQYLASLFPDDIYERTGQFLYERSLVMLESAEPSPRSEQLRAVALLALNRRPAAMLALKSAPDDAASQALREYANGNARPGKDFQRIENMADRFTAVMRNEQVRKAYGLVPDFRVEESPSVIRSWLLPSAYAITRENPWRKVNTQLFKQTLDTVDQTAEFSMNAVRQRVKGLKRAAAFRELTNETFKHIKLIATIDQTDSIGPRLSDYAHIVRGQLTDAVIGDMRKQYHQLADPKGARGLIDFYAPVFEGHPAYQLIGHQTYQALLRGNHIKRSNKPAIEKKMREMAIAGVVNARTPDPTTTKAKRYLANLKSIPHQHRARFTGELRWPAPCTEARTSTEACVAQTLTNFDLFERHVNQRFDTDQGTVGQLLEDNKNRFLGHEKRLDLLYKTYLKLGDVNGLNSVQQEFVANGKKDWLLIEREANEARLASEFDEAANMILSYPGFTGEQKIDAVRSDRLSYGAGSKLYWAGAHKAASRVYQNTAENSTQSQSEITARARLATIDGDFDTATELHKQRIERYTDLYAIRDYIGLNVLAANAQPMLDWSEQWTQFLHRAEIWHGLQVAHRAIGSTALEQYNWVLSKHSGLTRRARANFDSYVFMMEMLDRATDGSLSDVFTNHFSQKPHSVVFSESLVDDWRLTPLRFGESPDTINRTVKHPQFAAALALQAAYANDFEKAESVANDELLCHGNADTQEFLWVCAWIAVHRGRAEAYDQALESLAEERALQNIERSDPNGLLFDFYLALALLRGNEGKHKEALELLLRSTADQRYTGQSSLYSRYLILEVATILHRETGYQDYQSFVLQQAENFSIVDPIAAYNHSFIAMLSTDANDRIDALASLLKLDPNSRALAASHESELEKAKQAIPNK